MHKLDCNDDFTISVEEVCLHLNQCSVETCSSQWVSILKSNVLLFPLYTALGLYQSIGLPTADA